MKLTTAGIPVGFDREIIGIVTRSTISPENRCNHIFVGDCVPTDTKGYQGLLTTLDLASGLPDCPFVHRVRETDYLKSGDIVVMEPSSGFIRSLYRPADKHNSIFVTERCNSNCVMCSQPPKDKDDIDILAERNLELVRLIDPAPEYLTITGGNRHCLENVCLRCLQRCAIRCRQLQCTFSRMEGGSRGRSLRETSRRFATLT